MDQKSLGSLFISYFEVRSIFCSQLIGVFKLGKFTGRGMTSKDSANKESYKKVFSMLKDHNKWFENSIPLIASENIPSPAVREAIISDFGNRYAKEDC